MSGITAVLVMARGLLYEMDDWPVDINAQSPSIKLVNKYFLLALSETFSVSCLDKTRDTAVKILQPCARAMQSESVTTKRVLRFARLLN